MELILKEFKLIFWATVLFLLLNMTPTGSQ